MLAALMVHDTQQVQRLGVFFLRRQHPFVQLGGGAKLSSAVEFDGIGQKIFHAAQGLISTLEGKRRGAHQQHRLADAAPTHGGRMTDNRPGALDELHASRAGLGRRANDPLSRRSPDFQPTSFVIDLSISVTANTGARPCAQAYRRVY